jgi:glutamate synthase (ferredoxin)
MKPMGYPKKQGLYDPRFEHDSCGIGFVVNIKGKKSHTIVKNALTILRNLQHRGACGCEANTGDGAGILIQTPHKFFKKIAGEAGITLPPYQSYASGAVFLTPVASERKECIKAFERIITEEGLTVLGWRDIPTDNSSLGFTAVKGEPLMKQIFIARNSNITDDAAFERKLYIIRKRGENDIRFSGMQGGEYFYVPSLSYKTFVYKGMLTTWQLEQYYPDLSDPDMESAIALVHSRFSTNTFPSWDRAHPYRYIIHNGEINTLRGNINWMHAREAVLSSSVFGDELEKLFPIIQPDGSDSANFDNCVEFLTLAGRPIEHSIMMMIPEPWSNHETMSDEKKAFYEYHSCLMEPWDGPASIAFTDGFKVGAVLDRNGLRPSRYYVTKDDTVIMGSEVGVLDVPADMILKKGRLQPGRMFLIDTVEGRIVGDDEIKDRLAKERPYREWLNQNLVNLSDIPLSEGLEDRENFGHEAMVERQRVFGYTFEDLKVIWARPKTASSLSANGQGHPGGGFEQVRLLFEYFRQLPVTNPRSTLYARSDYRYRSYDSPESNILDCGLRVAA